MSTAGRARPAPEKPGRAHVSAAVTTMTRNETPVLLTTSSIVMYCVVDGAYGDGAAYGSWVGAPYCGAPWPGYCCRPVAAFAKPRPNTGLLLGIVISSR